MAYTATTWTSGDVITATLLNHIETGTADAHTEITSGKTTVAAAITAMGQTASVSDTYAQLATKIQDISDDADAAVANVLSGKTFYQSGTKKTGTMPNRGYADTTTESWTDGAGRLSLKMPTGAYVTEGGFGAGYCAPSIEDTDFVAANIKNGVNVLGVVGTHMPDMAAGDSLLYSRITSYNLVGYSGSYSSCGLNMSGATATKVTELVINFTGVIRVRMYVAPGPLAGNRTAQIYKNGSAVGTLRTFSTPQNYTEDISVTTGDYLSVYLNGVAGGGGQTYMPVFELYAQTPFVGVIS